MRSSYFWLFLTCISIINFACKNESSANTNPNGAVSEEPKNDSKALEGTGASDVSSTYKLDQTQIVQAGDVAFHFKTANALKVYIKSAEAENINFTDNEVFAIFAGSTIKETSFIVEKLDTSGEVPVLNVNTKTSDKTVQEYRPSYVVKIPKNSIKATPTIRLNGVELPVFGMQ